MRLVAFSVQGYRRFVEKTSVKLHGDLVAIVGPNEAGKSSLLRAIAHLGSDKKFDDSERIRRAVGIHPQLAWHFQLDDDDKASLDGVPDSSHIERVVITKNAEGEWTWRYEPRNPRRDRSLRESAFELLTLWGAHSSLAAANANPDSEFSDEDFDVIRDMLAIDVDDYDDGAISAIRRMANVLRAVGYVSYAGEDPDEAEEGEVAFIDARDSMAVILDRVADEESAPSPWQMTTDRLELRIPEVILFQEEDRNLASQYDLNQVATSPPPALNHLARLAELNLVALLNEINEGAVADVATRRNAANQTLLTAFEQSWNQQGIAVQVEVQGSILHIQATTPEDSGLSSIRERSDGLRWFAALLAFAQSRQDKPILLVDEIETHLHYDAQADLVAVLSKQEFTSKVIYTTHSLGCLPFDLGTGVRVVHPIDSATSRLENGFWRSGAGFSPLLVSMGATAMSFTPTRHAIIAEGPADAILLPTLLRQASQQSRLGFQIAPGLSSVPAESIRDLDTEAGRVGFVVDGDAGGKRIANKLVDAGISRDRIVMLVDAELSQPYETEDLVDPGVYAQAVNDELRCWNELAEECLAADLGDSLRTKTLARWCEERGYQAPDKTAVAQRIVDLSSYKEVWHSTRTGLLRDILTKFQQILSIA
jgi:predicted ATP-dependent endonuclease of OLD family